MPPAARAGRPPARAGRPRALAHARTPGSAQCRPAGLRTWQAVTVTDMHVRDATRGDLDAIAAVAIATGQVEEWSGSDPAYTTHLLAEGRVLVAENAGGVTGFGATR